MGTSSILGACILQSIAECVGIGKLEDEFLLHAVLLVEQLLSSGGGWQDQAHGILPGFKTVRSLPSEIPLDIQIEHLDIPQQHAEAFEERLLFAYTGQTRLAKNILQQVLRRWSRRSSEIVNTVGSLVECSENARKALLGGNWDEMARIIHKSFDLKCIMAGEDSGAQPETVKILISKLLEADLIEGAMLCGAGGGGFLLLLLSQGVCRQTIENFFESDIVLINRNFEDFRFQECHISNKGLSTSIIDDELIGVDSFHLSWHAP